MIGTTVISRRRWRPSIFVFFCMALFFLLLAIADDKRQAGPWIVTMLLAFAAVMRALLGHKRTRIEFRDDDFRIGKHNAIVRYDQVRGLRSTRNAPPDERPCYPVEILLGNGAVRLPARLSVPSRQVEEFLLARLPPQRPPVDQRLSDFIQQLLDEFGSDRVWWANGYPAKRQWTINGRLALTGLFLAIGGLVAIAVTHALELGGPDASGDLSGAAVFIGVTTTIIALIPTSSRNAQWRRVYASAVVVVSPLGLALCQGDLQGEARWEEVQNVRVCARPPFISLRSVGSKRTIVIQLAGATVRILDVFDRPLREIGERILGNWR